MRLTGASIFAPYLGRLHISQLVFWKELRKVQWAHVHIAPPPPLAPPIGGSGDAFGPTKDVCREVGGDGAENHIKYSSLIVSLPLCEY